MAEAKPPQCRQSRQCGRTSTTDGELFWAGSMPKTTTRIMRQQTARLLRGTCPASNAVMHPVSTRIPTRPHTS
ncbi:hypothetical protein NDU88_004211 [Pleurodeles waltl]|uniref:Uncharacterized protein n=1 Tax=Pleurodeles waltl TaxID=8319 RepID=A0AAV7N0U1_PLEWA|nr:hypothetical protein NDU88_004211 [Pleurodeles waltl]